VSSTAVSSRQFRSLGAPNDNFQALILNCSSHCRSKLYMYCTQQNDASTRTRQSRAAAEQGSGPAASSRPESCESRLPQHNSNRCCLENINIA
jgi:hypothetical protein